MKTNQNGVLRAFGEWEEQELLMLSLPHAKSDWAPYLSQITASYVEFANVLCRYQNLLLIAPDERYFEPFKHIKNASFFKCATNDTWIRDYGAIDVLGENGAFSYDFSFNAWGGKFESGLDDNVNALLFESGALKGELRRVPFVLEGGSVEFNGRGVLLTTSKCLLNENRAHSDKGALELKLKELFNLERIIWLDHGEIIGDDTDSHIDTLARFVNEKVIVYCACDDKNDAHFMPLKAMENELKNSGFELVPLFLPRALEFMGRRLGATYCNFVFINDALIVPTYGDKKADERALGTLKEVVKNRDIIGVDARIFIRQNGSLHCSCQNRFKAARN